MSRVPSPHAVFTTPHSGDNLKRSYLATVVQLVTQIDVNVDLGSGMQNQLPYASAWALSDGRLLSFNERNLRGRVYIRSGKIHVRAPNINPSRASITSPSQIGTGFVLLSRPTTKRSLLQGLPSSYTTPANEVESSDVKTTWVASTGIVDTTVTTSETAPKYRIYGSGLYGPTGYWVTKSRSDIRIHQTVNVEWYATDYECATVSYNLYANGSLTASGTMNSNTFMSMPITFSVEDLVQLSVTISDENGKTVELVGPTLQVHNLPILSGVILLPIEDGRYRIGTPVTVRARLEPCSTWSVMHVFNNTSVEVSRGTLVSPKPLTIEFDVAPPELGSHRLDLILSDTLGPQDPADTVSFLVVAYDELISS